MSDSKIKISIVVPVYGCKDCLHELVHRLDNALLRISENYEIIMVNDASPDGSWEMIKALAIKDKRIKGINFSRNFGQHYAITAGLDHAHGQWVVVMDCDLQDQPEEIPKLYAAAMEGYDIVWGQRKDRQDNFFKKLSSRLFYWVFDYFTDQKSDPSSANFGIYSERVIKSYLSMREQDRIFPLFVRWLGYRSTKININHGKRIPGASAYTFSIAFSLAIDSIVSQSNKPLKLAIKFGLSISFFSMVYVMFLIGRYFISGVPVQGWTSIMVSLYFLSGLLLANMGILGMYLGKVFNETKQRPLYVIKETVGLK
jgi:polyisoprenyl-phosphate glycosyltransferase